MKMIDSNRLLRFIHNDAFQIQMELDSLCNHGNSRYLIEQKQGELREAHYIMGLVQAMSEERED